MGEDLNEDVPETSAARASAILMGAVRRGLTVDGIPEVRRQVEAELAHDDVMPDSAAAVRVIMEHAFLAGR